MRAPGRVFTRTQLCQHVWEYHFDPEKFGRRLHTAATSQNRRWRDDEAYTNRPGRRVPD